jgi:hypothetical protein
MFCDEANGINGACGSLLIHTEKGKTKAKEAEERQRQRKGERDKLVMYEVVPKEDRHGRYAEPILTAGEKKKMREGLNTLPQNDLGDH